jgi:hypothetical protein
VFYVNWGRTASLQFPDAAVIVPAQNASTVSQTRGSHLEKSDSGPRLDRRVDVA